MPSLWRNRNYLFLLGGQTISSLGSDISQLAFPLLILARTHSPALAGGIGALQSVPYLFFSLPLGAFVDRWNPKRVMLLCDTSRALNLLSIPLAFAVGHLTSLQLALNALIEGSLFVAFNLAETAGLLSVISREQLPTAIAQYTAAEGTTSVLGPPLGGVLYSLGQGIPFLCDAISYLFSVASLLFLRTPFHSERTAPARRLHQEIGDGVRWVWYHPLVRSLTFLGILGLFAYYGISLIVIVVAQSLGMTPALIGLLFASGGVMTVGGSVLAPWFQKKLRFGQIMVGASWGKAVLWPLLAVASTPLVLVAVVVGLFFIDPIYNVVHMSARLALIPDGLQGRVNSVVRLLAFSLRALGLALTGVLIQTVGVRWAILSAAAVLVLVALGTTLNPHIRNASPFSQPQ